MAARFQLPLVALGVVWLALCAHAGSAPKSPLASPCLDAVLAFSGKWQEAPTLSWQPAHRPACRADMGDVLGAFASKRIALFGDSTNVRLYSALVALLTGQPLVDPPKPRTDLRFAHEPSGASIDYFNTPYWEEFLAAYPRELAAAKRARAPYDLVVVNVGLHDLRYRPALGLADNLDERFALMLAATAEMTIAAGVDSARFVVWREFTRLWDTALAAWVTPVAPQFCNASVVRLNALARDALNSTVARAANLGLWRVYAASAAPVLEALSPDGLHSSEVEAAAYARGVVEILHAQRLAGSVSVPQETKARAGYTASQKTLALLGFALVVLWLVTELTVLREAQLAPSQVFLRLLPSWALTGLGATAAPDTDRNSDAGEPIIVTELPPPGGASTGEPAQRLVELPTVSLSSVTSRASIPVLRHLVLLLAIVAYMWLADGTEIKLWTTGKRAYSRDLFLFVNLAILLMSALTVETERKPGALLNRAQTEEWKGWMQVAFVLYHYFAAKETYNVIRTFISAYVWLTGFGNFSYFYIRKDFSFVRFVKMMFRLNFLVAVLCAALAREYMLYYVCALHTFAFLSVYAMMFVGSARNESVPFMSAKLAVYALVFALLFEVPGVFDAVFAPFAWLLSFNGSMYEWHFRAHLDHYMPLLGMLCAYLHPNASALVARVDGLEPTTRMRVLAVTALVAGTALALWARYMFVMDKFAYNRLHPYTAAWPIAAFLVLRNLTPGLRSVSLYLFGWLGKVTLETYLLQFHVWLSSDARTTTEYVPGYPLLNFALATVIFVGLSYKLFHVTVFLSDALAPTGITRAALLGRMAFCVGVWVLPFTAVKCLSVVGLM